jgi:hypothetical protein
MRANDNPNTDGELTVTLRDRARPLRLWFAGRVSTLSGPVGGGARGRPFGTAVADLDRFGYVEEEYFLDGEAAAIAIAGDAEVRMDGRWDVVETAHRDFATRLLVRRPADPERANGTVYVEWQNVSGGVDIDAAWLHHHEELMRSGYAWVGVSAQRAGVQGPALIPGLSVPLVEWDPERYGTRVLPDDACSYDIFTQAGRAIGPRRDRRGVDPLDGIRVERVLAAGQSQSAGRLASYVNAVQPSAGVFDGFFIAARGAWVAPLGNGMVAREPARIRDDVDGCVFRVNTEGEALASRPVRQPDTERYRYWEIAGSAHQGAYATVGVDGLFARDLHGPSPAGALPDNDLPAHRAMQAALWHLDRWVRGEAAPPECAPVEIAGDPLEVVRDAYGNAAGGVRLPELAVPTKQFGPFGLPTVSHRLRGFALTLPPELLRRLYETPSAYLDAHATATEAAVEAGILLEVDASVGRREARDWTDQSSLWN